MNNWPEVQQHISNFLIRDGTLNCKPIKAKLSELLDSVTEGKNDIIQVLGNTFFSDSRDATLLWALHGYLVPWQRVVTKQDNGQKNISRFTITDSQESFVLRVRSYEEAEDHLRHRKTKNLPIQPFIITIGEDITKITDCYVYFDDLKIPLKSFIRAVDICFKIYHLFNLEYPKASITFWNFIQVFFFKIKSKENFSKVNILIEELVKMMELC